MSLLLEIQEAAVDSKSDLASLLRRCKILAARLDSKPLEDWLLWEANGYPDEAPLPDYRMWGMQWKGHFSGMFGSGMRNASIPSLCLPTGLQEALSEPFGCHYSIASIESMLAASTDNSMRVSNPSVAVDIGDSLYIDMNCLEAWGEFGTERFVNVLNAVRNRVLDFVLAVWKEEPNAGEIGSTSQTLGPQDITQIFNTVVYRGGANVIGSSQNSTITVNVTTNDHDSLLSELRNHGISEEDLNSLRDAISAEPEKPTNGQLGPRVANWVAAMVGKAATGTWNIGIGAAGQLLGSAIGQYYGIGV